MEITSGQADRCGATPRGDGTNFAIWSSVAERVELCLFDSRRNQLRIDLPDCIDGVWHGFVPGCGAGQRYGFRVHGPWQPAAGLRCNPAKVVLDPYARMLDGSFDWTGKVFDYRLQADGTQRICAEDNSMAVPLSVVCNPVERPAAHVQIPWADSIIYESNVRGFTMRHPAVPESDRGRFAGMSNGEVIRYLKALGVTSIEIMPVLAFIDEQHLFDLGLRNFWGYNTIGFFAPMPRYAGENPVAELCDMVRAVHDAGLEIILDVAYNHTGEGDGSGPTLCFRGIDNLAYYRTEAGDPSRYVNDTGCGNTINADHPRVQSLILDSLRYLHGDIGFDGFRFDLAPILGRHADGFSTSHPLLAAISADPALSSAKLVAEPWDPGPGGYQLGNFPDRWAEWNDDYRDAVRRFWRGDAQQSGHLARRIHGSSDIFEARGRAPAASVNLVTAHDGFTLADVVSYEHRHNEANGEENRDGHQHNFSHNYGVEGPSDDAALQDLRRRQRLNMLATLLFSQGTPMLLAGDEFGHTQGGNNNAYAQDNETAWLDWSKLDDDPTFVEAVRQMIGLRRKHTQLRMPNFVHEVNHAAAQDGLFQWFDASAAPLTGDAWAHCKTLSVLVADERGACLLAMNTDEQSVDLQLPAHTSRWELQFSSGDSPIAATPNSRIKLVCKSLALFSARR